MYLIILLYALSLLATILAFRSFTRFWRSKRQETLAASENLRARNGQILDKNKKLQEENKDLEKKVSQTQNLYEVTREIGATLEFESTFQILSGKLKKMFSFRGAGLILLEEKEGKIAIKRILEIKGREIPPRHPLKSPQPPFNKGGLGGIKACPALDAGVRGQAETESSSRAKKIVDIFESGQRGAILIPQTSSSLQARRLALPREVESFVAIPLLIEKDMLAIMTMENIRENDFDRLSVVVAQLALTIKKAQLYQEVQKLSLIDGLTGAFLRRHFRERLEEELQRSRQQHLPLSFLMADIDHFKEYNDKYGHLVGDVVLKDIARLLEKGVREIDLVGRYGGEEFSLLLTETNKESALQVAERLRISIEKHQFKAYDEVGKATISIGLATFPEDAQEAENLIDKADRALYKAKQSGRNRVCPSS